MHKNFDGEGKNVFVSDMGVGGSLNHKVLTTVP